MKTKIRLTTCFLTLSLLGQAQLVPFTAGSKMGITDKSSDKTVVEANYDSVIRLTDELFIVSMEYEDADDPDLEYSLYGIINGKTANQILPIEYDRIDDLNDGLIRVQKPDGYIGFVDVNGKEVLPNLNARYDDVAFHFSNGFIRVEKNFEYGFINTKGEEIIPIQYSDVRDFSEGLAAVRKDFTYGFINTKGELVIPYQFKAAYEFSEGMCKVLDYNSDDEPIYGFIDSKGKLAVPYKYATAHNFVEGLAIVSDIKTGKSGFINKKGEEVVPLKYDSAFNFSNGKAFVWLNGESFYIDSKGKKIN